MSVPSAEVLQIAAGMRPGQYADWRMRVWLKQEQARFKRVVEPARHYPRLLANQPC